MRFFVYLFGLIVVLSSLSFMLATTGITREWGPVFVAGIIVIILGIGIMASSQMYSEGLRARRNYNESRTAPQPTSTATPPPAPREKIVEEEVE